MNKESFESLFVSYTWKRRKHLVKMFIYVTKDYIFAKIDFFENFQFVLSNFNLLAHIVSSSKNIPIFF